MSYRGCIARLKQAAGRELTDLEVQGIFERIHKAALDIKAGRLAPDEVALGMQRRTLRLKTEMDARGTSADADLLLQEAAQRAAMELQAEAAQRVRQANLQLVRMSARLGEVDAMIGAGVNPLEAVRRTIARDYSGRMNVESLEQRAAGTRADLMRKLLPAWDALGNDWLGFFQSREKLLTLVRELRGEATGDQVAARGAKAFQDTAEEARRVFNAAGGQIGKLDDWGMPQHHSQERVAAAGRDAWVDAVLPMLDRGRYVDDAGVPWTDPQLREFLGKAWDTIATNGHATREPGQKGVGKVANRHAESRQIHFRDADAVIGYWERFGDKTAAEILMGHVETMARDIAFIEHFGPNPNTTYQTLRDTALKAATKLAPRKTTELEGQAVKLDILYDYAAGRVKPSANATLSGIADGIAHLNTAGKLGGSALASLFGDKPMMEAVAHLNNLPAMQRWYTELALLNPGNAADRRLLMTQGLMLDSVRSGLQRFYEGLGSTSFTGKMANAVMRVTGMQAINDIRKGAFGVSLMNAIGHELQRGRSFADLDASDVRALRHFGISETDWRVWQVARLDDLGSGNVHALTPEAISRIPDADLQRAGILPTGQIDPADGARVRREAIVKLLGAVNTESEFAIVTPGWQERAAFYGDLQRGTAKGEINRSWLQFKSFPWAFLQRSMDAVANKDGPVSKTAMAAFLVTSTTLAGAMLLQTREMLSGKDPRDMNDRRFWAAAFISGGALGIYGDFLYGANQTRYGSGILEAVSGPTLGPLLEIGLTQPMDALRKRMEGKESHLLAKTAQDLKGWVPGGNIWYTKAVLDHLVWQNVFEALSPGYLASIRSKTMKEYGQDWWWQPGRAMPDRAPDVGQR